MTKKEAFRTAREDITFQAKGFDLLNKIYHDFESRTCKNCKYSKTDTINLTYCYCPTSELSSTNKPLHPTFGCNQFKRKDK